MIRYADEWITRFRYSGARLRSSRQSDAALRAYKARSDEDVFYIVGSGASLNNLSEAEARQIESGTSAAINMAGVAPLAFDIYSIEHLTHPDLADSLAKAAREQEKPALFWFQWRNRNVNEWVENLAAEFPMHRYRRASVSIRRNLATFHHIYRRVMRHRVFEAPDLNVCFALTGSVARLVLLGCMLGYRRICFVGIDLTGTPYFWQEQPQLRGVDPWVDRSGTYAPKPTIASFQGGSRVVPNLYEFLRCLKADRKGALQFETLDPAGRSALTEFLRTDYWT